MRKSFTRLFSMFILFCGLSLQMAFGIGFDGLKSVPKDADLNVKPADIATKFVVAFDAVPQISAAGGTLVIYKGTTPATLGLYKTYPINTSSASVKVIGKTLEVTHGLVESSFVFGDDYSIAITDGAVVGLAAGALAQGVFDFEIGDYVKPNLLTAANTFTPNKGVIDVMANLDGSAFTLKIPFDEKVTVPTATNDKAVYIYKEDGTVVDIIKVGKIGATTLTSDAALTTPLAAGVLGGSANVYVPVAATSIFKEKTKYYVTIDAGAFLDVNGNVMSYDGLSNTATWTFTTRDHSAPAVTAKSVTAVASTTATLNVTLDEKGKYYYATYPTATVVTAADVINDGDGVGGNSGLPFVATASGFKPVATAGTNVTAALTGLTGGITYKTYIVSENSVTVGAPVTAATAENVAFTTIDNTAPVSIARGVLANSGKSTYALYMVFDEQVQNGTTGTLDLRKDSDDSYVKQITSISSRKITTAEVTANTFGAGRTTAQYVAVVDLGMTLPSKTDYYVVFPAGFIIDMATTSNSFAGAGSFIVPINKGNWAFTSTDFEAPTVTVAFATPNNLNSDINVTFNETVTKQLLTTTDWAQVLALEVNDVVEPFTVTSPLGAADADNVVVPNYTIVINPTATLAANTTYKIRIRPDAVKDLGSTAIPTLAANAVSTEIVRTLTTGDLDPFTVTYGSTLGATTINGLLADSKFVIDFNKAVNVNTTGTTWVAATAANLTPFITFTKTGAPAGAKAFLVDYNATTFTITITPSVLLISNAADYVVSLNGAKVRDSQTTLLSAATGYSATKTYSVKDYEKPVATNSHDGNVSNIVANANPTITFTDANLGTLTDLTSPAPIALTALTPAQLATHITFKQDDSNSENLPFAATYAAGVITIVPTAALVTGKTYYYGIGASVKDATNNVTDGKFTTFTMVAPAVAPTIIADTYTVNTSAQTPVATALENVVSVGAPLKVTVSVTFNDFIKEMDPASPNYVAGCLIANLSDGTSSWNTTIGSINVSGKVLTIDFATGAALASDAVCTLTLPAKMVQGSSYIAGTTTFAQFAGKAITFKSKDLVAPSITATTPGVGAGGIALNTALKVDFNEKVVLGSGNILIKENVSGTTMQTIEINATNVNLDYTTIAPGTRVTITKADLIKYNTAYDVVIPAAGFKDDISLNPMAANYTWTFTTVVNPQPIIKLTSGVITVTPADNSDQVALSPLSLGITFSEEIEKYTPVVGTRKLWYLIEEGNAGIRAGFDGSLDLTLNGGNDVPVADDYIENLSVGVTANTVTIVTGFTPVAGKRYYVLITPGSFLDKSTGTSAVGNPVPGVFGGVIAGTTWNFTTKDENPGTVTFEYTKRTDNLVATTSDIVIKFTRPIVKSDGTAITDAQVANLFTLTKTAGPGTPGVKAFIGTISADKMTVTILNSSLVTLGEMTAGSNFTIAMNAGAIKYANNAAIVGAADAFSTSNYDKPTVASVFQSTGLTTPTVVDIYKDPVDGKHKAKVRFDCASNPISVAGVQTALKKVYYTIEPGTAPSAAMTPSILMLSATNQAIAAGTFAVSKTFTFSDLVEETSYVVYAVVEDVAGNISTVNSLIFTTDDVSKPLLSVPPTAFDVNKKLTFTFNENITVTAGNNAVRILDKNSMTVVAVLNLNAVTPSNATNDKKLITDAFAGLATTDALVNYYVEVEAGIVADVPVVALDAVNTFDGLFRTDLEVSSKDATAPVLSSTDPVLPATGVDVNFSIKLNFSEPVKKATTLPVDAFVVEKEITPGSGTWEPFEVIDPANVVTNGTEVVTVTLSRVLASTTKYQLSVKLNSFTDLTGTPHAVATAVGTITTKDVVSPVVTYAPTKGQINVPVATANMTLDFNEVIRLLDNSVIDNYDLDSLVYFKKAGVDMAFDAVITNPTLTTSRITITPAVALVADATYTYGFKAKFEDASNNAVPADAATFNTVLTTPAAQYLSWLPARKSPYVAPWTWVATAGTITLNFTNDIFTHEAVAADNNLPVTSARIIANSIITVKKTTPLLVTTTMAAADLLFTTPNNRTIVVAPKAGTTWGSSNVIEVIVNGDKLQINEGNITVLGNAGAVWDASKYLAEDTIDPIVDVTKTVAPAPGVIPFTAGFYPAKVGVAGVAPTIAKTDALKLFFNEDVKVGTGLVEIRYWDGELAKAPMAVTVAADKRTVTLGDLTGLPTNEEYYAIVQASIVVDNTVDVNPYAGMTDVKVWKFNLRDDAYPVATLYTPTTDNQPVTTDLTINFDRPVIVGTTGYVALYKSAAGGDAVQIWRCADNGATAAMSTSGSVGTINISNLEVNTKYYVEVAEGTFTSAVDNTKGQAAIERSSWTFTTEVNTAPSILATGYSPVKDAIDVPRNADLQITFDMEVQPGSGIIQLHKADGSQILNFPVTDPALVNFNGAVVTVSLPMLSEDTQYYVIIPGTTIRNKTYTPEYFAGLTVPYVWKFNTVVDATPPTVTADKASGTTITTNAFDVTLTFSEAVVGAVAGITTTGATTAVVTEVTAGRVYKVAVTAADLATVKITAAATITDAAGNPLAATEFTYNVADNNGPTLTVDKASGSNITTNAFNVVLTFNEDVTGVAAAVTVSTGSTVAVTGSGKVYTAAIVAPSSSAVVMTVANTVKDIATNAFAGAAFTYNVSGDVTAPSLTAKTPTATTATAHVTTLEMTFDENVVKGTGKLYIYNGATIERTIDVTSTSVVVTGTKATITLAGSLNKNTTYFVYVDNGFVADVYANKYVGISNPATWTFTTGNFAVGNDPVIGSLEFKVYPNPFVNELKVDNASELSRVIITSMTGQKVKEIVNPTSTIQTNDLRSGVYFISLYVDDVVAKTERIVKR